MKFHLRVGWWLGEVDGFDDKGNEENKFCYVDIYFVVAVLNKINIVDHLFTPS